MVESKVELFWLPVGAGTHFQRASLIAYDWLLAHIARRPRAAFVHAALKVRLEGRTHTLELMPVPRRQETAPLITGPVGLRIAGRLRMFRYQLLCQEASTLPDERWAIESPNVIGRGAAFAETILSIAAQVPAHTWGRRVAGTTEMWTSDSAISWLLCRAGVDIREINPPSQTQAPGWAAGIQVASTITR